MAAILTVRLDRVEVITIDHAQVPCEITPAVRIDGPGMIEFIDSSGAVHGHELGQTCGWLHLSVRIHANLACQADCIIASGESIDREDVAKGVYPGIRFQPFFLPGAPTDPDSLTGLGLFARGLHFSGQITPGWVKLSCECDACRRSFRLTSMHMGFSDCEYMYSGSGQEVIALSAYDEAVRTAFADPRGLPMRELEARLPAAPDGTRFAYTNSLRCPNCAAPYIDFARHPDIRNGEYYANLQEGQQPLFWP